MDKINWTDRVRNVEVMHRVKEERELLRSTKLRKANRTDHTLQRNCLLKHDTERQIQGTGR
jgi:hypothetical protein